MDYQKLIVLFFLVLAVAVYETVADKGDTIIITEDGLVFKENGKKDKDDKIIMGGGGKGKCCCKSHTKHIPIHIPIHKHITKYVHVPVHHHHKHHQTHHYEQVKPVHTHHTHHTHHHEEQKEQKEESYQRLGKIGIGMSPSMLSSRVVAPPPYPFYPPVIPYSMLPRLATQRRMNIPHEFDNSMPFQNSFGFYPMMLPQYFGYPSPSMYL